jgi:capsular polysaccharide transport system permease protein
MNSAERHSLSRGFRIEARTVGALIMRELHTRFGRDNIGYLWLFLEPALLAGAVAAIHLMARLRLPWGMDIVPFYVSGYTAYALFRATVNRAGTTLEGNSSLLYHRPVTIFDLLLARAVLDAAAMLGASTLILMVAAAAGGGPGIGRPLLYLLGWFFDLWFCMGLSMLALAGCVVFPTLDRFIQPTTYLLLPLSGVFFIIEQLPPFARAIVAWIPLAQITQMIREGVFQDFNSIYIEPGYIVAWCMSVTLLGLLAIRAVRPQVEFE